MVATKPSGIVWIGNIPADWDMNKIKYISTLKGRIGWQGLTSDEYTDEGAYLITGTDFYNGGINWETCVHVPMKRWEEAKDIQIENGDLLITKDGTVGKVAIVNGLNSPCSLNSGVLRVSTTGGYDRKFLYWVLQSEVFWTWFSIKNAGNSTILHLYQGDFAEFKYAIPPLPEQQTIAAFLDDHCGQIDGIIADLEQQLEILRQYKKALITETVTKGLDKSAPMKGSGIDWIGQMPRHWMMQRVKYVTSIISKGATPEDIFNEQTECYPIRFLKAENIKNSLVDSDPEFYIDRTADNGLRRSRLQANDLLFVIAGATIGKVAQMNPDLLPANINQAISFLRPNGYVLPRYLLYVLDSYIVAEVIQLLMVQAAQPNISMANLGNIEFPLAPRGEQAAIVDFLDRKCAETDDLIAEKQKAAKTMRQYKKSLIYEYVTGKKRVAG
ncbi:MAG: restriction endonuclease subunit S [Clostridia bacterium]|nr:restriction endonuclease subunit S [Clostridia bacterium]